MAMSKFSKYSTALPPLCARTPPLPIHFVSKVKKMEKVDGPDPDKTEWINLEVAMDPENPASGSNYSQYFTIFNDRFPEEWIK
jgi:hypothetical protein